MSSAATSTSRKTNRTFQYDCPHCGSRCSATPSQIDSTQNCASCGLGHHVPFISLSMPMGRAQTQQSDPAEPSSPDSDGSSSPRQTSGTNSPEKKKAVGDAIAWTLIAISICIIGVIVMDFLPKGSVGPGPETSQETTTTFSDETLVEDAEGPPAEIPNIDTIEEASGLLDIILRHKKALTISREDIQLLSMDMNNPILAETPGFVENNKRRISELQTSIDRDVEIITNSAARFLSLAQADHASISGALDTFESDMSRRGDALGLEIAERFKTATHQIPFGNRPDVGALVSQLTQGG